MSDVRDRLQQLLDGELEPSEIADDAALVSLADRLYGIKIAPAKPVKARDFVPSAPGLPVTEVAPPTEMLIEVIQPVGGVPSDLPDINIPNLENPSSGGSKMFKLASISGLIVVIANLFGLFSSILEGVCDTDQCRGVEQTRINWMSIHKIGSSDGWSYSLLGESMSGLGGQTGGIGIPDVVAICVLLLGTLIIFRKK